jgi:RNA polymerase sigma-70 factor (ECF subfamily)
MSRRHRTPDPAPPDPAPKSPESKRVGGTSHGHESPEVPAGSEVTVEGILAHAGFVRALARGLLRDEAQVDDVVQETLTRALESGPRRREALGAWLRAVVQNVVFKGHRGRARRERREADAARAEALPGVGELFARESALHDLTHAVLDLPEQAREAVLLRYYDGLSPQAIGARLGLPPGTVRMRLHRALVALRRRLDEQSHGDRQQWLRGLGLLAGWPPEAPAPHPIAVADTLPGAPGATVAAAVALVAVATVGLYFALDRASDATPEDVLLGAGTGDQVAVTPSASEVSRSDGAGARVLSTADPATLERLDAASPGTALDSATTEATLPSGAVARGRVVDAGGVGVPGATVLGAWGGSELVPRGTTSADGTFELRIGLAPDARGMEMPLLLAATAPEHAPSGVLVVAHRGGEPDAPVTVHLRGPGARCEVRVVDDAGAPVAGALVTLGERLRFGLGLLGPLSADDENPLGPLLAARLDTGERAAFPGHPDLRGSLGALLLTRDGALTRQLPAQRATTDAAGRATFVGLEPGSAPVHVGANGFAPLRTRIELSAATELRVLALTRGGRVTGRLQRADGLALGPVLVHAIGVESPDVRTVAATADGRFVLDRLPRGQVRIVAEEQRAGHASARAERTLDLARGAQRELALELAPQGTLVVRVTGGGAPLVGWRVEVRGRYSPVALIERAVTDERGLARLARSPLLPAELWVLPADPVWSLPLRVSGAPFEAAQRVPAPDSAASGTGHAPPEAHYSIDIGADEIAGAYVIGRLLLPDGAPVPAGTWVQLSRVQRAEATSTAHGRIGLPGRVRDESGTFELGPLPLGTYRLNAPYLGLGTLIADAVVVSAPGRTDLGAVRVPERSLLSLVRTDGGLGCTDLLVTQVLTNGTGEERCVLFDGRAELPVEVALGPGLFELRFGAEPPRRVTLAPGTRNTFECR